MRDLNKNHRARIRRVVGKLDKALDGVTSAAGELWPVELRDILQRLEPAALVLRELHGELEQALRGKSGDTAQPEQAIDAEVENLPDAPEAEPEPARPASRRPRAA